jgi:hypothetical protein
VRVSGVEIAAAGLAAALLLSGFTAVSLDNVYAKGDSRLGAMFNLLFALDGEWRSCCLVCCHSSSPLALFIREASP